MGVMKSLSGSGGGVARAWVSAQITGDKELIRKFQRLETKGARKAMRAGIGAGMTPIAKALRAAINATAASTELKREARKTVGKKFGKVKGGPAKGQIEAKVGYAVGKKTTKQERPGKKGVGISAANIHWFVLGLTKTTGTRRLKHGSLRGPKAGHPTGLIEPPFAGTMQRARAASQDAALAAARAKISQVILLEAQRKG